MKVWLHILGGAVGADAENNIGASCYLLIIKIGKKIYHYLIDAGAEGINWRGPRDLATLPAILNGRKIDHLLCSHAHRDHAAAIPLRVIRENTAESARLICSRTTAAFIPYVLRDQIKVSSKKDERPPYAEREFYDITKKRMFAVNRPRVLPLAQGIWVLVWPSAHIRGACSFIFLIQDGKKSVKIMFSGDYCTHGQLSTMAAPLPPQDWYPDIIASFDCTNGGDHLPSWRDEIARERKDASETVKNGGWFLKFGFSLGRCAESARTLADLGIPVYLDGPSAVRLWSIMEGRNGYWCAGDQSVSPDGVTGLQEIGSALKEPVGAIVAPSGMGHGPAANYLTKVLPMENATVAAGGFQAHGTNGFTVMNAKRGDTVSLVVGEKKNRRIVETVQEIPVLAHIEYYRQTAHSLRENGLERIHELLRYSHEPTVGLCHGPTNALDWFQQNISTGYRTFRQDRPEDRAVQLV